MCSMSEKSVIDKVIDNGPQMAGDLDYKTVHGMVITFICHLYYKTHLDKKFIKIIIVSKTNWKIYF